MTTPVKRGPFDAESARKIYESLGPLTENDIYRLISLCSDKRRRESLNNVYGFHGATIAEAEYKRMAKEL